MKTREEALTYGLSFPDVHFVGPFGAQKTSPGRLKDRCVLECLIHSRHVFPSWLKNFDPSRDSESEKK